jgi:hypothetical protein
MTTIAIVPEIPGSSTTLYRAVSGNKQSVGQTAGQALDALATQLDDAEAGTLIVVQTMRPDALFPANHQQRLAELMDRWRTAREGNSALAAEEQAELEALVQAEVRAAAARAAAVVRNDS